MYNIRPIRITPVFLPETKKARRSLADVIQTLRDHNFRPRLLYPAKLSITVDGKTKIFHEKNRFTQYLSTNPALQRLKIEKCNTKRKTSPQKKQERNLRLTNPKENSHANIIPPLTTTTSTTTTTQQKQQQKQEARIIFLIMS